MKYKRILVLLVAAFLLGACSEEINQYNETAIIPEVISNETDTSEVTATSAPTFAPTEAVAETLMPTVTPTKPVAVMPTQAVTPTKEINPLEGDYWCELYREDNAELLTATEISLINQENFEAEGTGLVRLPGMECISSADIIRMIEAYSFPKQNYYDNTIITDSVKTEIFENRNIEALKREGTIEPAYGILIQNADLRSFPATKPLTSGINGRYDYLQETVLLLNEAVVVLHHSLDGEWCFVQAENYFGWIREASIAYCEREAMEAWYDTMTDTENQEILLVTKNVEWNAENGVLQLRMGTKLKYEGETDGKLMVYLPARDKEKRLQLKTYPVSPEDAVYPYLHRGYLPYTRSNVIRLATTLLDTPYGWGDALPYGTEYGYDTEIGMDCSSTVSGVYRCFGFVMPRNTGAQRKMAWQGEKLSGLNASEKRRFLERTDIGTLLYSSGHVMFYLGEYEGEYYVLHNTTTEKLQDGTEEAFYRCVITSMSLGEKGKTILEGLLEAKVPVKTEE